MKEKNIKSNLEATGGMTSPLPGSKKPRIESSSLFQGEREVVIVHHEEEYNLRITRNGKLILTK